ncbi:MAG: sensor histidine kinase [Ruminococcus sp.]|nr:sensor histidine kinase [Ruminococcus sp.]
MKEISLNILDIAKNSTKAKATLTTITINETEDTLTLIIGDNGCGMDEETVKNVSNPFYTTRTTRKVGMGIPLLKLSAEQTGGSFEIKSKPQDEFPTEHGTVVTAVFNKKHIDFTPLGDVTSSIVTLIQGDPQVDFLFTHNKPQGTVSLDTRELREVLGEVPLDTFEVIMWITDNLNEQYNEVNAQ